MTAPADPAAGLLAIIADAVPAMISYFDRDRVCRFANRAYQQWVGRGAPVLGRRLDELVEGERLRLGNEQLDSVLAGAAHLMVREGVAPSGERRTMEVSSVPHTVDGVVLGAVTIVHDVTTLDARRRETAAENAALVQRLSERSAELAASETFLRAITDSLPYAVAYWDRDLACRFANRQTRALFGATEDIAGRRLTELVEPETVATFEPRFRAALAGEAQRYERRLTDRDGQTRLYESVLVPHAVGGEVAGVIAVGLDLTERDRASRALADSEARFRVMVDNAPLGVLTVDPGGVVTMANGEAARMFGHAALAGRSIDELVPEVARPGHPDRIAAFFAAGVPRRMGANADVHARRGDGTTFPVEIALSVIDTPTGRQALVHVIDISDRVRAQLERVEVARKLTQAQHLESLGVLAGGIAHDFNNLLTGVLGSASLLRDTVREQDLPLIAGIRSAAERASELCQQILAYAGRGQTLVARVGLSELVRDTAKLIGTTAGKRATIRLHLADDPLSVNADSVNLRQVLLGLVANAAEALPGGAGDIDIRTGRVQLTADDLAVAALAEAAQPGEFAFIEVKDAGSGIAPELRDRVFEPFFTTKPAGSGLGLAAVRGIVRAHQGVVELESQPGVGTKVRVCLPVLPPPPRPEPSTVAAGWRGEGRCLVIDDEPVVRTLCQAALERLGFAVELASDGDVGLAQFDEDPQRYALALIDLSMPRVGGVATYAEMRQVRPEFPVVFMSGRGAGTLEDELGPHGRYVFIAKPFDLPVLTTAIRKVLGA